MNIFVSVNFFALFVYLTPMQCFDTIAWVLALKIISSILGYCPGSLWSWA